MAGSFTRESSQAFSVDQLTERMSLKLRSKMV